MICQEREKIVTQCITHHFDADISNNVILVCCLNSTFPNEEFSDQKFEYLVCFSSHFSLI